MCIFCAWMPVECALHGVFPGVVCRSIAEVAIIRLRAKSLLALGLSVPNPMFRKSVCLPLSESVWEREQIYPVATANKTAHLQIKRPIMDRFILFIVFYGSGEYDSSMKCCLRVSGVGMPVYCDIF